MGSLLTHINTRASKGETSGVVVGTTHAEATARTGNTHGTDATRRVATVTRGPRTTVRTMPSRTNVTDTDPTTRATNGSKTNSSTQTVIEDAGATVTFKLKVRGGLFTTGATPPVCP